MIPQNSLKPLTTTGIVPGEIRDENRKRFLLSRNPIPIRPLLAGVLIIVALLGFFGLWFSLAPISSAVVSPGIVQVASHRKTIQHFEGGIVDEILVRDGDLVVKGQPLVKLKTIGPAAELAQLEGEQLETAAIIGRLSAEQNDATEITLPEEFEARANEPALQSIMEGQQQILESIRKLDNERGLILEQNIAQAEDEISGLRLQLKAGERQRELLNDELSQLGILRQKELIPRTRVLARQQELARVEGNIGQFQAEIARIKKSILELKLNTSELRAAKIAGVTQQLREERAKLFDLTQRITSARDVLSRTTIVSPVAGEVVNIQVHTTDGVIRAGQPIMDIVPQDDDLVVQAFIDPKDIDEVRVGLPANVVLTSISRRSRVPIEGVVSAVSADRLVDQQTGQAYYEARIEVPSVVDDPEHTALMAGMGADVFIRTGERTAFEYLAAPIFRNLQLGTREK